MKDLAEFLKRMGAVVGHELRNPLAVIGNSAYFIKAKLGAKADAKLEKHIGIIESEIKRANQIIGEIVAYTRPLSPNMVETELKPVVEEALHRYAPPAGIALAQDLAAGLKAKVDPTLVQDALRRLLDNAAEAMAEGGTIKVSLTKRKGWAALEVADAGAGFKAEQLELMLEPFYTTKTKSLGLGLPAVQKIALAHQGKLEASARGGGAVFTLLLPA